MKMSLGRARGKGREVVGREGSRWRGSGGRKRWAKVGMVGGRGLLDPLLRLLLRWLHNHSSNNNKLGG